MAAEVSHAPAAVPSAPAQGVAYRPPRLCSSEQFDAAKHLSYKEPSKRYTMKELGLEGQGIGPIALTEPFPLFTPAAVVEFRKDVLSDRVLDEYTVASTLSSRLARQAREYNPVVAPFVCSAFSSPEVTALVSAVAGIELVPIMQLELGHTNYMCGKSTSIEELKNLPIEPSKPYPELSSEEKAEFERKNDLTKERQIYDWHFDSYPYVCVVMLSDTTTMLGGETGVRCGDGSIRKVIGPSVGYAAVLQGRHVRHIACKGYNTQERITLVTSYRAKDPLVADHSVLSTIRIMSSNQDRLNAQWSTYRFKLLADRFAKYAAQLEARRIGMAGDHYPQLVTKEEVQKFCEEQIKYLSTTYSEMMPFDESDNIHIVHSQEKDNM